MLPNRFAGLDGLLAHLLALLSNLFPALLSDLLRTLLCTLLSAFLDALLSLANLFGNADHARRGHGERFGRDANAPCVVQNLWAGARKFEKKEMKTQTTKKKNSETATPSKR